MGIADDTEAVAAVVDLHSQPDFDLAQIFVEGPAQIGQSLVVGGFEDEIAGIGLIVQGVEYRGG